MSPTLDKHARCVELLPAFVAGTLPPDEARAIVSHTSECAECGAELETARRLHAFFAAQWSNVTPLLDPAVEQAGFDRLWARITAEPNRAAPSPRREWQRRLVALAAIVPLGVAFAWYWTGSTPQYRTLADPTRTCIALQFPAETPRGDALRMIEAAGASVVGSESHGVYTVSARDPAESLRRLRLVSGVTAQPLDC